MENLIIKINRIFITFILLIIGAVKFRKFSIILYHSELYFKLYLANLKMLVFIMKRKMENLFDCRKSIELSLCINKILF